MPARRPRRSEHEHEAVHPRLRPDVGGARVPVALRRRCDDRRGIPARAPFGIRNSSSSSTTPRPRSSSTWASPASGSTSWSGFPHRKGPEGSHVKQAPDQNPIAQLAKIGVKPEDIDYVVISHLMSEHAGYLPEFAGTKAKIVVQEAEMDYASRIGTPPRPGDEPAVEQFHTWMYVRKLLRGAGARLSCSSTATTSCWARTWRSSRCPGHTPGFQNVMVRLPKTGPVFLSACEHRGMYYDIPVNGYAPGIPHAFTWSAAGEL